jgi:uncharacterized LabA/DUF88 family protein
MAKRALILIDGSNLKYFCYEAGWWISWTKLQAYFQNLYDVVKIIYYEGFRSKAVFFDFNPNATLQDFIEAKRKKHLFFTDLQLLGYKVVTKPVSRVFDVTEGDYKHKCNFDVEMTVDAIDRLDTYDECILCSGDGDFIKLLRYLKGHKKKTVILAPKKRINWGLAKVANKVIFLERIRSIVEYKSVEQKNK